MGGLQEVAHNHDPRNEIELGISCQEEGVRVEYRVALREPSAGTLSFSFD